MKASYFPHDFCARTDPKMQEVLMEHGVEGIGIYWCIVEMMYEQGGELPLRNIKSIAYNLHTDIEMVDRVVKDFDLFIVSEDKFYSKSLNSRLQKIEEKSEKARASIKARWSKIKAANDTNTEQMQNERNTNVYENDTNVLRAKNERNTIKLNKIKDNSKEKDKNKFLSKKKNFSPPLQPEVAGYFADIGSTAEEAAQFFDHFTANGWLVSGRAAMRDWKAAARNWIRNAHKFAQQNANRNLHTPAASLKDPKREFAETAARVTEQFMRGEG